MEKATANKGETTILEPTRPQRTIARRAAESRATVPYLELSAEVTMDACASLVREHSRVAVLVRACGLALHEHPRANAAYRDGRYELYSRVNVAVPVASEDAYALATVFDADRKSPAQITAEIAGFAGRTLTAPELSGATFSVSAPDGVRSASPLIASPHAAALGAGEIAERPAVRDGVIVPSRQMTITLACDHRILYGHLAAAFLQAIASRLEAAAL